MKARTFWLLSAFVTSLSLPAHAATASPKQASEQAADAPADSAADSPADGAADSPADGAADSPADGAADSPADGAEKAAEKPVNKPANETFGHARQFGLRVGLTGGYNMIFRYDQSPLCSPYDASKGLNDQQKFCGHAAPLALDIAASFAVIDSLEPYLFMRLGLAGETQTDTLPIKVIGAGARIYTMSDSAFKVFIEPALAYEFEGSAGTVSHPGYNPQYKKDLLIHLAAGPHFDVARYVGFFVDGGLTTGILRALHTTLELQAGVQARFP